MNLTGSTTSSSGSPTSRLYGDLGAGVVTVRDPDGKLVEIATSDEGSRAE